MHSRIPCALLAFFLIAGQGLSQKINFLEIEVGTNVSSFPVRGSRAGGTEATLPVVGPLLGIWLTPWPDKRFTISGGVQYFTRGQHYRYSREGYDLINRESFRHSQTEVMKFQATSAAVHARYVFRMGRYKAGVSIGYRVLVYSTGQYLYKVQTSYETNTGNDTYYEKAFSPFDENLYMPAKRSHSQFTLAIHYSFTKRWTAVTSYSVGTGLLFTEPFFGWCATGFAHSYNRGDIGITVKYRI